MSPEEELAELHTLYPHMNQEQLLEAQRNLERYLKVVIDIYWRRQAETAEVDRLRESS